MAAPAPIPVTVLTGFLGAGKTTLLNRILAEHHGQRLAVIENELGEIGIDQALVISADEEIFEMSNGCICCTVRGDLIRVLGSLVKRRDRFDRVLVETTGMANPGPVAQTFFVDPEVRADFVLDGIITVVDAHHLDVHLADADEAHAQIGFADVIVLNKLDLVGDDGLARVEQRVRSINAMARVVRGVRGQVPLAEILDVGGFDLARALERAPTFLEPEYPFEWAGGYALDAGPHELVLGATADPTMSVVLVRQDELSEAALRAGAERVLRTFSEPPAEVAPGGAFVAGAGHARLRLDRAPPLRFAVSIPVMGAWALYTQHRPDEVALRLERAGGDLAPAASHEFAPAHVHDDQVTSVALEFDRPFTLAALSAWLSDLLRERGADILRTKGILDLAGEAERFVFQAVHMLTDARSDRPWPPGPRRSQIVFIGRGLDREELVRGLEGCLA